MSYFDGKRLQKFVISIENDKFQLNGKNLLFYYKNYSILNKNDKNALFKKNYKNLNKMTKINYFISINHYTIKQFQFIKK